VRRARRAWSVVRQYLLRHTLRCYESPGCPSAAAPAASFKSPSVKSTTPTTSPVVFGRKFFTEQYPSSQTSFGLNRVPCLGVVIGSYWASGTFRMRVPSRFEYPNRPPSKKTTWLRV